jgi:hypothetical protein
MIEVFTMALVHLSLQHVKKFNPIMLERREYVGILGNRDEIGLDHDAASVRADMTKQIVLMTGPRASPFDVHAFSGLDENGTALFLKTTEK